MGASQEGDKDTEHWSAVLREVRRQVKHVADATGVESLVEGKGRFFDDGAEETWQVGSVAESAGAADIAIPLC